MKVLIYDPLWGESIEVAASDAIELAKRHNRKVRFNFNGVRLTVNKRLSVQHVVRTWWHATNAHADRYEVRTARKLRQQEWKLEIEQFQIAVDNLFYNLPMTKYEVARWLAKYLPLIDNAGVDNRRDVVVAHFTKLGYVENQHVGETDFSDVTKKVEYLVGQMLNMLVRVNCVHPMIGFWAKQITETPSTPEGTAGVA